MTIYPAIDLMGGQCVRLCQGKFDNAAVYGSQPAKMAKQWEGMGAMWMHVVDLDGAAAGESKNLQAIKDICKAVRIPVQSGGGVRTIADIDRLLTAGVSRVILGTQALLDRAFLKEALLKYGAKIAVGIDAKDGMVATHGWAKVSNVPAVEFANDAANLGAQTIIYTDIAKDGMLAGPNVSAMAKMAEQVDASVIASGGVSCVEDLIKLAATGVSGAIVGKALYTGRVDLQEALERTANPC